MLIIIAALLSLLAIAAALKVYWGQWE